MKLLITGATGFVGRNLLLKACESGTYQRIYVPVRSPQKFKAQWESEGKKISEKIELIQWEAGEGNLGPAAEAEHVVHSAGVIFADNWESYEKTNVQGTRRLMEQLKNPSRVVVLSSLSASGPSSEFGEPHREGSEDRPLTWYGKSKLEMEQLLRRDFSSVPYVCLRPPMIFGPRDHATLPLFKMVRKPLHPKPGFRAKHYSILDVEDLVEAILLLLDPVVQWPENPHRYYYIAHPNAITDRKLLRTAARVVGRTGLITPVPQAILKIASRVVQTIPTWRTTIPTLSVDRAREIWPFHWLVSHELFAEHFGWAAKTSFEKSLRSTYQWYVQSGQIRPVNKGWQQVDSAVSGSR